MREIVFPPLLTGCTIALMALAVVANASAHGPTVRLAYGGVKPASLTVRVGDTVHFVNANIGGGACTVVGDDGSFESPPIARSGGWHRIFEKAGTFAYQLKEAGSASGRIVVVGK